MRYTYDQMLSNIQEFNDNYWADFYQLNKQYFLDISDNETLAMNRIMSDYDIEDWYEEEYWNEYIKYFADKVNVINKESTINKYISSAHLYTQEKQLLWKRWTDRTTDYFLMKQLVDQERVVECLCSNPNYAWNMYMLINKRWWKEVRCIFKPSRRLLSIYDFIKPKYTWSKLLWYYIDMERFKDYSIIQILPNDILDIYWWAYHPYIRSLVQNKDYSGLRTNLKI